MHRIIKNTLRKQLRFILPIILTILVFATACSQSEPTGSSGTVSSVNSSTTSTLAVTTTASTKITTQASSSSGSVSTATQVISEGEVYTSKDDLVRYIRKFSKLPPNFITKGEAKKLGWRGGSLKNYVPDKCIGGDIFRNLSAQLPEQEGRTYLECDVDTYHASARGSKRLVFSNDGLIYYTADHYKNFEKVD